MEMRNSGLAWFVDAWAVHDGRIFVSHRRPETEGSRIGSATTTVFMSVPDLQAVPVGRISTALRATRSGFQDGFRDAQGDEIPFVSLGQIRTLVQQAYLAAGLGPEAPGVAAAPFDVPGPDGESGAAALVLDRAMFLDEEAWDFTAHGWHKQPPRLIDEAVRALALASLLAWEPILDAGSPEAVRAFLGWHSTLIRTGAVTAYPAHSTSTRPWWTTGLEGLMAVASDYGAYAVVHACSDMVEQLREMGQPEAWREVGSWSRSHLALVPMPRLPRGNRGTRRLVEMSILPQIDRRFWAERLTALDIAPLVLISIVRGRPRMGYVRHEPTVAEEAFYRERSTLEWEPLPEPAAMALEEFIDSRLEAPGPHTPAGRPTPYVPSRPVDRYAPSRPAETYAPSTPAEVYETEAEGGWAET